jgi:soluble lytic murein transglycosylase
MKRWLLGALLFLTIAAGGVYLFNRYWIHRYDALIRRHALIYHLDPDLVWSIIYQETYFRPWTTGEHGEIGLMQVRPTVGREWAAETGMNGLVEQMDRDPASVLRDPERNIQIACWYLEKLYGQFRDVPGVEARMVAGYNAGPSRAVEWNRVASGSSPLDADAFIARIDIPSTRAYVTAIIQRYREVKAKRAATAMLTRPSVDQAQNDRQGFKLVSDRPRILHPTRLLL